MNKIAVDHRTLFNIMPIPRFLVTRDDSGEYYLMEVNEKVLHYFDKSREAVIGKNIKDLLNEDNLNRFYQSFEVSYKHKTPVSIKAIPTFPGASRITGFIINPFINEDGEVEYVDVVAHSETTDHSMLQRERDDAISLLSSIFDVSEVGIIVSDENRRIVKINESFIRIYGWSRDDLIGSDFSKLVVPEEQESAKRSHDEFIKSGQRSAGEMKFIRKDASTANVLFTTATLVLSHNRRFQVTTVMDITLRKQMELSLQIAKEQADMANHAKSSFLANMSHELRTPLNAIIGFSEMMSNETFGKIGDDKYKEYLGDIHLSACHLLEIINEVLDMSKIEAGRVELDEVTISLPEIVDTVSRMMASRAFSKGLKIIEEVQEGIPDLKADLRILRQILINLVTNAIKFSEKGGNVIISAKQLKDSSIELSIIDHGIGIPEDCIKEAMEPFGQIKDPVRANNETQGTGLGLPLSRAMAELHGGSLDLVSKPGVGTTVKITFPAWRTMKRKVTQKEK